jgi:hypothetical protein
MSARHEKAQNGTKTESACYLLSSGSAFFSCIVGRAGVCYRSTGLRLSGLQRKGERSGNAPLVIVFAALVVAKAAR